MANTSELITNLALVGIPEDMSRKIDGYVEDLYEMDGRRHALRCMAWACKENVAFNVAEELERLDEDIAYHLLWFENDIRNRIRYGTTAELEANLASEDRLWDDMQILVGKHNTLVEKLCHIREEHRTEEIDYFFRGRRWDLDDKEEYRRGVEDDENAAIDYESGRWDLPSEPEDEDAPPCQRDVQEDEEDELFEEEDDEYGYGRLIDRYEAAASRWE